tara:strand:+ start:6997 stop:7953 length:957 start_codon:yes stop_codon:yes gene_type:complete
MARNVDYKDYYQVLGVASNSNEAEIKRAYRKLARKYHPDVNPGDGQAAERFKEINEAYQVLGDSSKRTHYDRFGADYRRYGSVEEAARRSQGVGFAGGQAFDFGGMGGFSEFFDQLFGHGMGGAHSVHSGRRAPQNADIESEIKTTLQEIFYGGAKVLNLRVPSPDGQIRNRKFEIKIPRGVREGAKIRLPGEGLVRTDGAKGDLYLKVLVAHDQNFERRGDNLVATVDVPLTEAVLGASIELMNIDRTAITLKIPAGTQNGAMLRLKGQGLYKLNSQLRGDLLVKIVIQIPTGLSMEERRIMFEFGKARGESPNDPD